MRLILSTALVATFGLCDARGQTQPLVAGTITNPVVVNIFWDENWDADNSGMTRTAINNFTWALFNSTYFSAMMQDFGVNSVTFGGAFQADGSCGGVGTVNPTAPTSISIDSLLPTDLTVNTFIWCEAGLANMPSGSNVIYNIFFPSSTQETDLFGLFPQCGTFLGSETATGYHFHGVSQALLSLSLLLPAELPATVPLILVAGRGPLFTANFAFPACVSAAFNNGLTGFSALTTALTHEIVEAITDPNPPLGVILQTQPEIADVCEPGPPPAISPTGTTGFLASFNNGPASPAGGQGSNYFSTSASLCVPGLNGPLPMISSVTFNVPPNGSPLSSLGITVSGSGFGTLPLPLSNFVGNSPIGLTGPGLVSKLPAITNVPYFSFTDNPATPSVWEGGNSINGDAVLLNYESWSDGTIQINGFGGTFGSPGPSIATGDSVTIVVCNPSSGACTTSMPATIPPAVSTDAISPGSGPVDGGTFVTISGSGFQPGSQTAVLFGGVPVPGNVLSTTQITANTPINVPGLAQVQVWSSNMTNPSGGGPKYNYCTPSITSLTPSSGPPSGGTVVNIVGNCLDNATTVGFGGAVVWSGHGFTYDNRGNIQVQSPPNCPGTFDVQVRTVAAQGQYIASPVSPADQFTYLTQSNGRPCRGIGSYLPSLCTIAPAACRPYIPRNWTLGPGSQPPLFGDLRGFGTDVAAIQAIAAQRILPGISPDQFDPAGKVTRGDFAIYLERMLGLSESQTPTTFLDLNRESSAYGAVQSLLPYLDWYIDAKGAFVFRPNETFDRQTAASVSANLLLATGKAALMTNQEADEVGSHIPDWREIDASARRQVAMALRARALSLQEGNFNPGAPLNRAETAMLLRNLQLAIVGTPR
jgi:hypothetical protein